jgi:hypothetical protein
MPPSKLENPEFPITVPGSQAVVVVVVCVEVGERNLLKDSGWSTSLTKP